ncbi:hypothetical protein GCM10023350_45050 [Nocardioides endophyticus]|uniref:DUF881 domain-containing protein n=1 Tax=Nocardioides endophyticus TaxID=1353775 RepID=A0ABP8ZF73_9ACTN
MPDAPTVPDRARTPLLTLITQESLDEDYQHVAEQRAAARARQGVEDHGAGGSGRRGHWVAAAVVAAFGMLVTVAAVQTSEGSGVADANRESLLHQIDQRRDQSAQLQGRILRLSERNVGLQDALNEVTDAERTTANRVDRLAAQAGYGPVRGPGIVITVDDAPNGEAVRAEDLALLANGLWAAGAEAIAINDRRLTARSAIFNSGAAINIRFTPPLSPPYVVSAIGDNKALEANLLDTSTGLAFSNAADALGFQVTTDRRDEIDLPAAELRPPHDAVMGTAEENRRPDGKETAP